MTQWSDYGRWTGDRVRREVFFFEGAGSELFGSLYGAVGAATARNGLVLCPSWGVEADRSARLIHELAHATANLGGVAVVFHYPGYGDSAGDLGSVTMEALAAAGSAAATEARARQPARTWTLAGFSVGASVACLAAAAARPDRLLLLEPALRPATYFGELARVARRVTLGAGSSETVAFGYPLPQKILGAGTEPDAAVARALSEFRGRTTVVRHETPAPEAQVPEGAELVTAPGTWRFGAKEHLELTGSATRWLERVSTEAGG